MINIKPNIMANRLFHMSHVSIHNQLRYLNNRRKGNFVDILTLENSIKLTEYCILKSDNNTIVYSKQKKNELIEMTEKYYWEQVLNELFKFKKHINYDTL